MNNNIVPRVNVPRSIILKQNAAVEYCDNLYVLMMLSIASIAGAIKGGGTGQQLQLFIRTEWPNIDGQYANMLRIAKANHPQFYAWLNANMGPSVNAWGSAIERYLSDGDMTALKDLAASFSPNGQMLMQARDSINRGGREKEPLNRIIADLVRPLYKAGGMSWNDIAIEIIHNGEKSDASPDEIDASERIKKLTGKRYKERGKVVKGIYFKVYPHDKR